MESLDDIRASVEAAGGRLTIYEVRSKKTATLSMLALPPALRGRGVGSDIMQRIARWADANGVTVTLTPSTDFGASSVSRLYAFYSRFGFKKNRGRARDFTVSDSMYRLPS